MSAVCFHSSGLGPEAAKLVQLLVQRLCHNRVDATAILCSIIQLLVLPPVITHSTQPPSAAVCLLFHHPLLLCAEVPPGRFVSQGLVRICPQGFYRENYLSFNDPMAQVCVACNVGITTEGAGAKSSKECNRVLPGYGISNVFNVSNNPQNIPALPQNETGLPNATVCPLAFYSANGYCAQCPTGTVTRVMGAKSVEECGESYESTSGTSDCVALLFHLQAFSRQQHNSRLGAQSTHACGDTKSQPVGSCCADSPCPGVVLLRLQLSLLATCCLPAPWSCAPLVSSGRAG